MKITFFHVLLAFVIYLLSPTLWAIFIKYTHLPLILIDPTKIMLFPAGCLLCLCAIYSQKIRDQICFLGEKNPEFSVKECIKIVAKAALYAYPVCLLMMVLIEMLYAYLGIENQENQAALILLRKSFAQGYLDGGLFVFQVAILIPLCEEILYRGFFQNWIRNFFSYKTSIVITSIFFAGCHLRPDQGYENYKIFIFIFVLSLVLGELFFRKKDLRVCIGLHMTFNCLGLILEALSSLKSS